MAAKKTELPIKAYLGENTTFKGSLSFEDTVRIDGKFEGQVSTGDTLIIGETGHVLADINAAIVVCMGALEGTIVATTKLEMHSTSRVKGNIKTPAMYMELGAVLDGQCEMSGGEGNVLTLVKEKQEEKK